MKNTSNKTIKTAFITLLVPMVLLLSFGSTVAEKTKNQKVEAANTIEVKKKYIPLEKALSAATQETPGEVVKVELEKGLYEVKVRSTDGKTTEVYLDAYTGEVLKKKTKSYADRD